MSDTSMQEQKRLPLSAVIRSDKYVRIINDSLRDPERAKRFVASLSSAMAVNPALQECEVSTVVSAALLGESLNLSPSPQLGHYYLVPFKDNRNGRTTATFILGYKGYLQLAMRSGQYKSIVVKAIKKGELVKWDEFNEVIVVKPIEDPVEREVAETIGYYASFEYLNGFSKKMYWSRAKMEQHAMRYSPGYKAKKGYTFWEKDFDAMAYKTMLRQLISKWGIMSLEMRMAYEGDDAVISEAGTPDYIGADAVQPVPESIPVEDAEIAEPQIVADPETGEVVSGRQQVSLDEV